MTRIGGVVAAALLAAAITPLALVAVATPAEAEVCSDAGVTVVVDFKQLGGGVNALCDADGGGSKAAALFTGNGYSLTYVQRTPGFVCRINGAPADDPCVNTPPADAYWGLWWSDGTNGKWTYSSLGVGSLTIPEGGSVAFAWDGTSGSPQPGLAPPVTQAAQPTPTPSPTPAPSPSTSPSGKPSHQPSSTPSVVATPPPTPTPSASPTAQTSAPDSESPTQAAASSQAPSGTDASTSAASSASSAPSSGTPVEEPASASVQAVEPQGLPLWVPIVVVGVLAIAASTVAVRRRRGAPR